MKNSSTHVWFRCTQLELNQTDFGLFYPRGAPSRDNNVLVEDDTLNEFSVFDGATDLLDNSNISQIDIRGSGGNETTNGLDSNRSECGGIL